MAVAAVEQVVSAAQRRAAAHETAYRELVERCGRGDEVDPDKVLASLTRWDRGVEQFQDDVEAYSARLDLAAIAAKASELAEQLTRIQAARATAARVHETEVAIADAKWSAADAPLAAKENETTSALTAARNASSRLVSSCEDPIRLSALATARNRRNEAQDVLAALRGERDELYRLKAVMDGGSHVGQASDSLRQLVADSPGGGLAAEIRDLKTQEAKIDKLPEWMQPREQERIDRERRKVNDQIAQFKLAIDSMPQRIVEAERILGECQEALLLAEQALLLP